MKHFSEISWPVDEPTYRKDPALSYSTIAKYERGGFSSLATLFDEVHSPSLTFGSVVDELITGDKESFSNRFIVAQFPKLEPMKETGTRKLHELYGGEYKTLDSIPDSLIITGLNDAEVYKSLKDETRIRKMKEQSCCDFYRLLGLSGEKEIISQDVYDSAQACVEALRISAATGPYFSPSNEHLRKYYQLKFKGTIDGVDYRCMADLIIVDYDRKIVIPCDLKTSGSPEYDFWKSFIKWRYDIQARLYWKLIRMNMDKDEYFKDFKLVDYRFLVVNKESRTPLTWWFPETAIDNRLTHGDRVFRSPWEIGKELRGYLDHTPCVPNGISMTKVNNICEWIDNETNKNQD